MRSSLGIVLLASVVVGCDGVPSDSGLSAELVLPSGQFTAGPMPTGADGPAVTGFDLRSNAAYAGQIDAPLSGALGPTATAAAIGLVGDIGYWTVTAGVPEVAAPDDPTFSVAMSFAETMSAGTYQLVVAAVDAEDRFGPAESATLTMAGAPMPSGALVVSLRWDTESDLDLHVVDPAGAEIWQGDLSPPGSGAVLDFDSNANCLIDGRREEDVTWSATPPSGTYLVRVDTPSLCSAEFANWTVDIRLAGKLIASAVGESLETDTEMPHDVGAGVLAVTFDVP